ncbi:Fungalysin metallopeptidase-domain-containing protein [Chytridium lagenaria]|nr:Fungalysin metallopeptidase-domain-containing protein [Chytridium lagenaria]
MNMYICDRAIPARDTGMDNGVIIHELTHGLSNRLTGGPANANCLSTEESGGMGEGWSDTLAWWSSLKSHDSRATLKVIGLYSFDSLSGIRAYPYSTSLVINPLRYSDAAGRTWLEVHYTGTIWSSMLYEVYWNMRDMDGFEPFLSKSESTAGNIRFMQTWWMVSSFNLAILLLWTHVMQFFRLTWLTIIVGTFALFGGIRETRVGVGATSFRNSYSVPSNC